MRSRTNIHLRLLAATAALAIAAPALAQSAAPADAAAADAGGDSGGLDEIVVTATKRETNLQKTPIAMNVLSTTALSNRHVQSLYDLADGAIPSLRVATFEARQTALTIGIRGIVPLDANQPAREQGVGIYVDGVYLGRQHGLNAALFEVERVEVLKGPQGTLFGRNTEGGALSIVPKAPTGEFGGSMTAGIANYGGYNAQGHINLPEFANISLKFDGVVQYQGATTKNPLAGQKGWNYFDRRGFRAAARWKPTSDLTVDLSYDIGYDANSPFYSQLLNYNPNGCVAGSSVGSCQLPGTSFTSLSGTVKPTSPLVQVEGKDRMKVADIGVPQQPSVDRTHGYVANVKWAVAPWVELRSITAWRDVSSNQWDNSGGAHRPPVVAAGCTGNACNFSRYSLADLYQHQFSQEFQAVGHLPKLDYAVGLYYFNERVSDDAATPNSNAFNSTLTAVTILDPCTGSAGFGSQVGCRSIDRASNAEAKSYAVFGQATYSPVDTIHVTVGGRNTWDDRSGLLYKVNNAARNLTYSQNTSRFDPLAIIAWDAAEGINLYGKFSTGYRSGGASSRSVSYREFGPEKVKAYEIGAKTEFLDHRVRLNLAGYIMDRKGSQIDFSSVSFDPATGSNRNTIETINAPGTTKIRGVEADLTVAPVDGLTLTASYAYTYTKIPPVLNPFTNVLQQVYIVFTPRNAASGSIDYAVPVMGDFATLQFHADGNYSQATQTFDQYATKNDSSFIVNARLSLADIDMGRDIKLTVSAWSRNLFNEAHVYRRDPSNSLPAFGSGTTGNINNVLGDYGNFNAPRTFGIEGKLAF
jgi:iron complex outermembrane recepter protein